MKYAGRAQQLDIKKFSEAC